MYIYFNKSYEATTVIPHGEILRQGGDLNLYVCLDEKLDGNSFFVYVKNKDKTCERICSFVGYQEFRKLKDSEVTYDLVEGNKYYVYHARFMPEESTCYSGKIGVSFEIDNVPTAAISLYVEKTFGYEIPNTNITQDQYLEIKELIRQIDAKKIELNSGILRKSLTYDFTVDDKNRLFIDDNGNIFTVKIIDNSFSPVIIASSDYELKTFIEKEYQKKLVVDELPTENSKNLITSDGVFKAIDEVPHVEVGKNSDNIMTSLTVDNEKVNLPTTSFDIEYEVENGKLILKSITFNGDKYNIKEYKEHEPVIVDSTISSNSLNPVQSRVLYQKFEEKVDKVPGKKLSANDFTDAYKNKLDNLEQISNKHNDDVNKLSGRITLLNTDLSNIKTKLENLNVTDNSELLQRISAIEKILESDDVNLDTLQEIVNALTNDESGLERIIVELSSKVTKVDGKQLSTNDFNDEYKDKLDSLENIINNAINAQIISILNTDVED